MKFITYNILNGGLGRLDPIYETLAYLDGDVVGLCEADDAGGVRYLGEKLGMEYLPAAAPADGARGVALLSRHPIERMVNLALTCPSLDRGAMEAVITTALGPVRVVLAHLQAGQAREDEQRRIEQLNALLQAISGEKIPTLLMGDLNAAAPYHPFDAAAASPRLRQRLARRGAEDLDHDAINLLLERGWVDAYRGRRAGQERHTYTTGFPATRFDYIWTSAELEGRVTDAQVEQGGFAPYCSDHYPLWASLDI